MDEGAYLRIYPTSDGARLISNDGDVMDAVLDDLRDQTEVAIVEMEDSAISDYTLPGDPFDPDTESAAPEFYHYRVTLYPLADSTRPADYLHHTVERILDDTGLDCDVTMVE